MVLEMDLDESVWFDGGDAERFRDTGRWVETEDRFVIRLESETTEEASGELE
jgi:hypothetical protein